MSESKLALNKAQTAVLAAFAVDAFSLSYHWVYDTTQIPTPVAPALKEPASKYHAEKGKVKGDLTHIGDQSYVLLQQLAQNKKFDTTDYAARFKQLFNPNYKGWLTGYTKHVLKQIEEKVEADKIGSDIDDLDPIGRVGPLLLIHNNVNDFNADAKKYVGFTNKHALVYECTDFFGQVLFKVLAGKAPVAAIEEVAKLDEFAKNKTIADAIANGLASKNEDTTATIKKFGQSCPAAYGLPGIVHLIAKYENDLTKASVANVEAGGDSSSRGMVVALVLGAYHGVDHLPPYTKDFTQYADIVKLLQQFN